MKALKSLLIILTVLSAFNSGAAILIVNNSNANPGEYYYLQDAIDDAEVGDTLYLQPSTNSYGTVSLEKGLTLMGVGYNPKKNLPLIAEVASITMDNSLTGATFIGLKINALNFPCNCYGCWKTTSNITVKNCDVAINDSNPNNCYGFNVANNITVQNCIIRNMSIPQYGNNVNVFNNIVYSPNNTFMYIGMDVTNVSIHNNLFMNNSANNGFQADGAIVENNIFYRFSPSSPYGYVTSCIFNNNLTYQTLTDILPYGTNTGNDNIAGQNPLFENLDFTSTNLFNPVLFNYRLQALSPGHQAGTDGTDIGPYGSVIIFSETGEYEELPVVREMNILNSTVPSGGTIQVHVKASVSTTDH
ncbi:MAG: hypothetical protein JNM00_14970 [Flavobacteriales bacterium]|nr:hypothetical protein [Flavobacteriales bacterium]